MRGLPYELDKDTGLFILASGGFGGSLAATQVAFGTGVNTIGGDANFTFTKTTGTLLLGVSGSANTVALVANTNGAFGITASGTNQSITLTPSGSAPVFISTAISGVGASDLTFTSGSGGTVSLRINGSPFVKLATTGNLLIGGLTTDGAGVLQLPTGTTSSGGITLGNVNVYQSATGALNIDAAASVAINNSGNILTINNGAGNARLQSNGGMLFQTNGSTIALTLDSSQGITAAKKIVSYNSVTTAGWGVSVVQADNNIAGTTNARSAAVASYTVGVADGTFVVGAALNVTTSTAFSFSIDCVYTDDNNVSRTLILPLAQLAGTFITGGLATNVTGAGTYESAAMTNRCKTGTTITIRPSAGGTYTTVVYNVAANIRQVG